jgi:hypothetical protein
MYVPCHLEPSIKLIHIIELALKMANKANALKSK